MRCFLRTRTLALDAREQGKARDAELLSKLRAILVGSSAAASARPPPSSSASNPDNAGLLARLRRILSGDREGESTETTSIGLVAHSLARQGKIDEAIKMCSEMARRGCVPEITVLSAFPAVRLGAGACLVDLPRGWSSRQELSPHSSVIKVLCKAGKFQEAHKSAVAMLRQGLVVETLVLNTLVYGLYKAGLSDQCFLILLEMASRGSSLDVLAGEEDGGSVVHRICGALDDLIEHSVCPDVVFYTTLVDGLCAIGKIEEAYFLYRNSAAKNEFSVSTCNALVQGLIERGRGAEVFPLVLSMVKNGFAVKNNVLDSLIAKFCEAGKDEMVLPGFYSADESLLDHKSMLAGLCGLGKVEEASRFLGDMVRRSAVADTDTLNFLVLELCKAVLERPENYNLFDTIVRTTTSSSLCSSTTYEILVDFLYKADRMEDVHRLVKKMLDKKFVPDSNTYNSLVVKLCEEHRVDDALVLLKRATCTVSTAASNCVLQALCKNGGGVDVALKFVEWMRTKDQAPDSASCNALMERLIKEKKMEQAFSLYHGTMVKQRFKLDKASYDAILGGLWESGKENEAVKLFQQMVRNGIAPDAATSNILIAGLCKSRKVDAALKIASILPTMGCVPDLGAYKTLLAALCERGDPELVKNLVKDMSDNGRLLDLDSYNTAFLCFSRSGRDAEIHKLFLRMMEKGCEPADETYELVFGSLCTANNLDGAWEALQAVIKAGFLPLRKCAYRPYLLGLLKAGRVEQAVEFFKDSIGGDPAILLDCFLEAGLVAGACDYYDETLADREGSSLALLEIIREQSGDRMGVACQFVNELSLRRRSISVGSVVLELIKWKRLDLAAGMVEEGVKLGCASSSTVKIMADRLLEENKVDELCKLFGVVLEQDEDGREIGLARKYIRRLLTRGEIDVANRIFEMAVSGDGGKTRKSEKRKKKTCDLYDLVITDFCKLGRFEEGARVLEHLYENGVLPRANKMFRD
ncbi:putative pentatricopeptide repeat-containing protein At1g74580 [Selaginella moellendorffii]|uniref:putative pentatricopeptide repeat-containing protein At1g74580 n=1 Tax=Selaginella moellendorffii TaxID=88036 RepID=UPI000D1D10FB|nr:putative pentatricopeptide repeat-containing protein At1g74580 [Selaginella moellendorffii]|eukprot:XP_024540785.1 putative pentatricopeptide repeat-containing protein At1g74580 [Selaginella moellendorffii]